MSTNFIVYSTAAASDHRRLKRIAERHAFKTCLACRKKGHTVKDCPEAQTALHNDDAGKPGAPVKSAVGICYRCASSILSDHVPLFSSFGFFDAGLAAGAIDTTFHGARSPRIQKIRFHSHRVSCARGKATSRPHVRKTKARAYIPTAARASSADRRATSPGTVSCDRKASRESPFHT
jgi:hypothetical protein